MIYRLGELFCGPGGLSQGAKEAQVVLENGDVLSVEHSWATDYDLDSCETFRKNIATNHVNSVLHCDVKDLDLNSLSNIDGFAYGFPCNDFSLVGEQKGFNGKFGPLYTYGIEIINRFNPIFFVAENVSGLSSANEGNAFKSILNDLEKSGDFGYNLTVHKYKSEQYGIPQTRHRIIIVGIRKTENLHFKVPAPITPEVINYVSSYQALENPPIPINATNNERTNQSALVTERLKLIRPGENVWTADLPEHLRLKVKGAKLSQIYKRLHPDKPSYTITGSGGGGTHVYHYNEPRALTNRERARIQTFPDNFEFIGSKESVRKQIGMAVPPKLSKVIFESILKTLGNIPYPFIEPNI